MLVFAQLDPELRASGNAFDDDFGDRILHMTLDGPLQRAGAVDRVVSAGDDRFPGSIGQIDLQLLIRQAAVQVGHLLRDLRRVARGQGETHAGDDAALFLQADREASGITPPAQVQRALLLRPALRTHFTRRVN